MQEKPPSQQDSELCFQRYSNDKYLSTKQSDIESVPLPALRILRTTETKKLEKKLRKILSE